MTVKDEYEKLKHSLEAVAEHARLQGLKVNFDTTVVKKSGVENGQLVERESIYCYVQFFPSPTDTSHLGFVLHALTRDEGVKMIKEKLELFQVGLSKFLGIPYSDAAYQCQRESWCYLRDGHKGPCKERRFA